ncbi:MAG: hypothetical protein LBL71_04630 [Endomicrobium sp.]|nr:hypothetical protein [Endomicrobium sp.]
MRYSGYGLSHNYEKCLYTQAHIAEVDTDMKIKILVSVQQKYRQFTEDALLQKEEEKIL